MINHDYIRQLISQDLDGYANVEEKETINKHLLDCQECQKYQAEIKQLTPLLKNWSDENVSADLNQKIKQKINGPQGREGGRNMKNNNFIRFTSGALVSIIVLFISIQTYQKTQIQVIQPTHSISQNTISANDSKETSKKEVHSGSAESYSIAQSDSQKSEKPIQYEPYYSTSNYKVSRELTDGFENVTTRKRDKGGLQVQALIGRGLSAESSMRAAVPTNYPQSQVLEKHEIPSRDHLYEKRRIGYPISDTIYTVTGNESYASIIEKSFQSPRQQPLSTFGVDVDTAAYSNIRRLLNSNQLPPEDAVRIEEMLNNFTYHYAQPPGNETIAITTEMGPCPWNPEHAVALIGLQAKTYQSNEIPPSNLVFLIDVSGSMADYNKLPLLKTSFQQFITELRADQRVAIVAYANSAYVVLPSTQGIYKNQILNAINNLQAGGGTAGGSGIQMAYQIARQNFIPNGNNRVILATDGDFNVGVSSEFELTRLIESEKKSGVYLTVLGFGQGNLKDSKIETLADKGNGNYFYIDSIKEGQKVLVHELGSTLYTVAKDVKIQVEFNPATVAYYKLIGYENRSLANRDFKNDAKDAGEMGAGHSITAIYEIVPTYLSMVTDSNDDLVYQNKIKFWTRPNSTNDDIMTVKVRYKQPNNNSSQEIRKALKSYTNWNNSQDFKLATAITEFGLLLRNSPWRGSANYSNVLNSILPLTNYDSNGQVKELYSLVQSAYSIDTRINTWPQPMYKNNPQQPSYNPYENTNPPMQFKGNQ